MNKQEVIIRHLHKESYRSIARNLEMSRRTVTKICTEYDEKQKQLENEDLKKEEKDEIVRSIVEKNV
jgi:DNA invertase Pin-like site-specific DNA recombinase